LRHIRGGEATKKRYELLKNINVKVQNWTYIQVYYNYYCKIYRT
jgi:hypothetical protein